MFELDRCVTRGGGVECTDTDRLLGMAGACELLRDFHQVRCLRLSSQVFCLWKAALSSTNLAMYVWSTVLCCSQSLNWVASSGVCGAFLDNGRVKRVEILQVHREHRFACLLVVVEILHWHLEHRFACPFAFVEILRSLREQLVVVESDCNNISSTGAPPLSVPKGHRGRIAFFLTAGIADCASTMVAMAIVARTTIAASMEYRLKNLRPRIAIALKEDRLVFGSWAPLGLGFLGPWVPGTCSRATTHKLLRRRR